MTVIEYKLNLFDAAVSAHGCLKHTLEIRPETLGTYRLSKQDLAYLFRDFIP